MKLVMAAALAMPRTWPVAPMRQQVPATMPKLAPPARNARCPLNQETTGRLVRDQPGRLAIGTICARRRALNSGSGRPLSPEASLASASRSSSPVDGRSPRATMPSIDASSWSYFRSSGILITYPGSQFLHGAMLEELDGSLRAVQGTGNLSHALLLSKSHHYPAALVSRQPLDHFE